MIMSIGSFFFISWRGWVLVKSGDVGFILVLPRYNFLSWLMLLPMVFFLALQGDYGMGIIPNRCITCKNGEETVEYLLLHCLVAVG